MTKEINDSDFEKEVLKSDLPVLIDFWAEWCGPCRMLGPIIDQIASEQEGKIKVFKMNIDNNPDTPSKLGVRSIPTMMIFKDGKLVESKVSVHPKATIEAWINSKI